MRRHITERASSGEVDLLVCDFLSPSVNLPMGLRVPALGRKLPALLFQHNVETLIWRRHYQVQRNPFKKAFLWLEWRKMRASEAHGVSRV